MRRGRRFRQFAKWLGTVACVLLLAVLGASATTQVERLARHSDISVGNGVLIIQLLFPVSPDVGGWGYDPPQWEFVSVWDEPLEWTPKYATRTAEFIGTTRGVVVPLWMLILPIALPTAILWWRDRRRIPPNHCRTCGYNLTGNVSGACPECGQGIA